MLFLYLMRFYKKKYIFRLSKYWYVWYQIRMSTSRWSFLCWRSTVVTPRSSTSFAHFASVTESPCARHKTTSATFCCPAKTCCSRPCSWTTLPGKESQISLGLFVWTRRLAQNAKELGAPLESCRWPWYCAKSLSDFGVFLRFILSMAGKKSS